MELTIDLGLQMTAENALAQVIQNLQENGVGSKQEGKDADSGAVVAVDVKTGEVLLSASYPTYDPARYREDFNELSQADGNPLYDHALLATYAPGSIYKMVTGVAAMDYAGWGRYRQVTDLGVYTKYADQGYTPACHIWTSSGGTRTHGTVNMMQALAVSCNYYFYEAGLPCPPRTWTMWPSSWGSASPPAASCRKTPACVPMPRPRPRFMPGLAWRRGWTATSSRPPSARA